MRGRYARRRRWTVPIGVGRCRFRRTVTSSRLWLRVAPLFVRGLVRSNSRRCRTTDINTCPGDRCLSWVERRDWVSPSAMNHHQPRAPLRTVCYVPCTRVVTRVCRSRKTRNATMKRRADASNSKSTWKAKRIWSRNLTEEEVCN